jgi:hypothetical protein
LLIQAVLVFQLALGMQWSVAHAASTPQQSPGSPAEDCPFHAAPAKAPAVQPLRAAPVSHSASDQHEPRHQHDCCHSASCQCHGAFAVMSCELTSLNISFVSNRPALVDVPLATWRLDECLRPPIG